ncbi:MAG TPA: DNA cytosine methyltransferase [Beijerinckiaceae bacterium]|nr:DNA cytosine methyltransferase [Beijerinckiaceae bacterium]
MQEAPRIVDLFCGCGGFALGAHAAGLAPTIAFDVDPILTSSFRTNHPNTRLKLADLSKVEGVDIRREIGGRINGVFGGPPCQAFSDIGHRKADDPRRSLLGHFFRIVAELEPTFFVMENVKGFPDRFRFHPTVWHSFRMIGNSVSPTISKAIFSLIAERVNIRENFQIAAE